VPIFRDSRYAKRGKVEGAIRVVEGDHDGLSARWVFGVATLTPGVIEFVGTYGLRFLKRKPVRITIESIDVDPRRLKGRERILFLPGLVRIVQLKAAAATLDWAIITNRADWAVEKVKLDQVH
jgi:hypothetical protein